MCLDCGCNEPSNDHGDPRHITIDELQAAADASGVSIYVAAANILRTLTGTLGDDEPEDGPPARFVLGLAYQAGRDPRIQKGADGGRDFFAPAALEKAAWSYLRQGAEVGLFHSDDPAAIGRATAVESYVYRNPVPWVVSDDLVVKKGDWVLGAILDPGAWELYKQGRITGWSPQGHARRITPGSEP